MTQTPRKSVPVDPDTQQIIRAARTPDSREHAALMSMLEDSVDEGRSNLSEAATLSVLLELGKQALREKVLETEYRAIAAEQNEEDRAVRAALRRRRRLSPRAAE